MELELVVDLDDAARLPRLPLIARRKAARTQSRQVHVVWHDDPVGSLAANGLALAKQHNAWRLERLLPGGSHTWPPGAPPPLVEQVSALDALQHQRPPTVMPVAAFDGRASLFHLDTPPVAQPALTPPAAAGSEPDLAQPDALDAAVAEQPAGGEPLTITLLQGELRAVTTQHRVSRVQLAGPDGEVLALALELVDEVDVRVPSACLAVEAISVARGTQVPPRHVGAPQLAASLSVTAGFAHVVGHLADVIVALAPAAAAGHNDPEPVHQMRVAVRRLRSAIAMFRPAVGCASVALVDGGLKVLGARLGPARDWDVFVAQTAATVAAAFPDEPAIQRLLAAAERRRLSHYASLRKFLESAEFRRLGIQLAGLAGSTAWHSELDDAKQEMLAATLTEFAARVLDRRLKRLVAAGEAIEHLDAMTLHGIRLRAKRLRYAAEIFAALSPGKAPRRYIRRLSALQERLGTLNDGAVAAGLLHELGGPAGGQRAFASGLILGFVAAHGAAARADIARAWDKFRRADRFWA